MYVPMRGHPALWSFITCGLQGLALHHLPLDSGPSPHRSENCPTTKRFLNIWPLAQSAGL